MKIKNNKNKIIGFCLPAIILAFFIFLTPVYASNSGLDKAKQGLDETAKQGFTGGTGDLNNSGLILDLPAGIGQVIGAVLAFVGILFFGLMIYGGLIWMTARGNEQAVTKAKDLITAAVIGLVIVLAAYAITSYIGSSLLNLPGT